MTVVVIVCVVAFLLIAIGADWSDRRSVRDVNARFAMMDLMADRQAEQCEICNGTAVYLCPICREPVGHSHENDFICETHSFVNPIRQHDGARISGDGSCHALTVIGEE